MLHVEFERDPNDERNATLCGAFDAAPCSVDEARELVGGGHSSICCKRCLSSLAKRDREFQKKARRWYTRPSGVLGPLPRLASLPLTTWHMVAHSVAAIAAEEGRLPENDEAEAEWFRRYPRQSAIARERGREMP